MNLKTNYQKMIFFIFIIQIAKTELNPDEIPKPMNPKCIEGLVSSFGLEGTNEPKNLELKMCPSLNLSCCKVNDQLSIFINWRNNNEKHDVEERFRFYLEIYSELLELLDDVNKRANAMNMVLIRKKIGNCKVLSQKISNYKIKKIAPKLKDAVKDMYDFFYQSYKGFYCTICDAEMNHYFNVKKKFVLFSEKFCRNMVANSLHVLIYFHIHFAKYLNLVSRFATNCSFKGDFNVNPVSPDYLFSTTPEINENLNLCKVYRNDERWMKYCSFICNKFNFTKMTDFFEPNIKKYIKFNKHLKAQLQEMTDQETEYVNTHKSRLLLKNKSKIIKVSKKKESDKSNSNLNLNLTSDFKKLDEGRNLEEENIQRENIIEQNLIKKDRKFSRNLKIFKKKEKNILKNQSFERSLGENEKDFINDPHYQLALKYENPEIFRTTINATLELEKYNSKFYIKGIDLYNIGKQTEYTEPIYNAINAQKLVKDNTEVEEEAYNPSQKVSSDFIFGIISFFVY